MFLVRILILLLLQILPVFADPTPLLLQPKNIYKYLSTNKDYYVNLRHNLHTIPEVSYAEKQTASKISAELKKLGYEHLQEGIGGTGIIATLDTGKPGKVIALRADMDGLPITEQSQLSYKSEKNGVMHACGHDGHMATLMLVAKALQDHKKYLKGKYKLIFQPAEEGGKGAEKMVQAGAMRNVSSVYGLHGWPTKKGSISTRIGAQMAGSTIFDINIHGRGGHAAMPQHTVNPIFVASHILSDIENLVQQKDPNELLVLNIASINSGTTYNVIADDLNIKGTLRTVSKKSEAATMKKLDKIVKKNCEIYGCHGDVKAVMSYPPTINTKKEVEMVLKVAREINDDTSMAYIREQPVLPAEDFSLYLEKAPGCFFFLGQGEEKPPLHSSKFDFEDDTIVKGAYVLFKAAIDTSFD